MRITVQIPDVRAAFTSLETDLARAVTLGMRDVGGSAYAGLKSRTASALGQRVANAWRLKNYPSGATTYSMDPAVVISSKAPKIIDAFDRGATIVPVNGGRFLAIPTSAVPRKGRRRMTPFEVESAFNQDLIIRRGPRGDLLAFVDKAVTRFHASQGRAYGRARAQRRIGKAQLVLMFTLVSRVKLPRRLDLAATAASAAARVPGAIAGKLQR